MRRAELSRPQRGRMVAGGPPYKVPLAQARLETGSMWVSLDGGPKAWVMPFGPVKKALVQLRDYVAWAQSGGAGAPSPAPTAPS